MVVLVYVYVFSSLSPRQNGATKRKEKKNKTKHEMKTKGDRSCSLVNIKINHITNTQRTEIGDKNNQVCILYIYAICVREYHKIVLVYIHFNIVYHNINECVVRKLFVLHYIT